MSEAASNNGQTKALDALERRAKAILKARSAYREMVEFYLTVFRRQIEWRDRLVVHPEPVERDARRQCWKEGKTLIECYDPGIDSQSLVELWTEMKGVFRRGNPVLAQAVDAIEQAESAGDLSPATWLLEQRPDRSELVTEVAERVGIEEPMLGTLARAVTLPHWQRVSEGWLGQDPVDGWQRFRCPTCGGAPALAEVRAEGPLGENMTASRRRLMHCAFCAACWVVPTVKCPACESTRNGDAKYYYTDEEPELRIDFCKKCKHYVKVVDADKIVGRVHLGLEMLTTVHLDAIAQEKSLTPLEVRA